MYPKTLDRLIPPWLNHIMVGHRVSSACSPCVCGVVVDVVVVMVVVVVVVGVPQNSGPSFPPVAQPHQGGSPCVIKHVALVSVVLLLMLWWWLLLLVYPKTLDRLIPPWLSHIMVGHRVSSSM